MCPGRRPHEALRLVAAARRVPAPAREGPGPAVRARDGHGGERLLRHRDGAGLRVRGGDPAQRGRRVDAAGLQHRLLGDHGVPGASPAAPHAHGHLRALLLHRAHRDPGRAARRSREPRGQRFTGSDPHGHAGGRVDARGSHHDRVELGDREVVRDPQELSRGAGEPPAAVREGPGVRVPAGSGRQRRPAPPHPLLALPRGVAVAGWPPRAVARRRDVRPCGGALTVHPAGDAQDRRGHRRGARLRGGHRAARRAGGRGGGDRGLLHRLPQPQRRRGRRPHGRRPARAAARGRARHGGAHHAGAGRAGHRPCDLCGGRAPGRRPQALLDRCRLGAHRALRPGPRAGSGAAPR